MGYFPDYQRGKGKDASLLSSVYFSEFPNRIKAKEIYELFGCIGKIVEVVISPRRNNLGKRFGFAIFLEVEDLKNLAIRLDNVMVDGKKIHANPPRFVRNGSREGMGDSMGRMENR